MKTYTAWELAGDWWWVGKFGARVKGGRVDYETATATNRDNVCLRRLVDKETGLATVCRTVKHDQVMELIEIEKANML